MAGHICAQCAKLYFGENAAQAAKECCEAKEAYFFDRK
jgi:hypothetical protein